MTMKFVTRTGLLAAAGSLLLLTAQVQAQQPNTPTGSAHTHDHDHLHAHGHSHDPVSQDIRRGIFEDAQIKERTLSDWEGDWQSVYPYLQDGTLDVVMEHKAKNGSKTAEEYRAEYETGYRTDVDRIVIDGSSVTFHEGDQVITGMYEDDGYEILTYKAGNRGVRYVFEKVEGDDAAPDFIQFSDHGIFPEDASHYHLYWGDDRAALLEEVTNWPTYYPSSLSSEEIAQEMLAH
ncbi:ZinT family metal-binding protein [Paracoccus actinidiae]|uniref:ZinT family metal-binding protein n=1 Tax=Paracoccus actinidiae TaxID=3064531 RepID=UPI00359CA259